MLVDLIRGGTSSVMRHFHARISCWSLGLDVDSAHGKIPSTFMRQCIERAFALLVQRWGILWRPLRCDFKHWTLVLIVCAKLHNLCLNRSIPLFQQRFRDDVEDDDNPEVILNKDIPASEDPVHTGGGPATRRTILTRRLQDKGVRRPLYAQPNSREM